MDISFDSGLLKFKDTSDGALSKKMLLSAAPYVKAIFVKNLEKAIGKKNKGKDRSTGELLWSVGISKARKSGDGYWDVKIGVTGVDSKGVRNGLKAGILEHGKSNQPARPFAKPTARQVKANAEKIMQDIFDSEMKNSGNT